MPASVRDDTLIARALAHDEDAWRALVERYSAYIHTIAMRGFGMGPEDAREILQDSCLRLFAGLSGYRAEGSFRAWLRQIVVNCCLMRIRGRHPQASLDDTFPDPAQQEALERVEQACVLREAVRHLDEPCRQVVSLFFFEKRSYREIAAELGVPEGTIASRLARALATLRTTAGRR